MKAPWSLIWAPRGACPLELGKRGQQALHPQPVHVDELPRQQRAAVLRRDGGGQDDHGSKVLSSRKKIYREVAAFAACRPPEIPWLTTQIISVRAPSEQTLRHGPPALPRGRFETLGSKRRVGSRVSLLRLVLRYWRSQLSAATGPRCTRDGPKIERSKASQKRAKPVLLNWHAAKHAVDASSVPSTSGQRILVAGSA